MIAGLIACVAVLAAATAFGVVYRRRNGVLRPPRAAAGADSRAAGTGAAGAPAGSGATSAAAARVARAAVDRADDRAGRQSLSEAELGEPLGDRATLVQFSSAFCAPCRATRRILSDVAAMVDGVQHVEIDAESHLDLVRTLGIYRTPTILVLGPGGEIVRRGSGQPRKADVIAALGDAVSVTQG